ncbi:hypothetical protein BC832DRAFT_548141 [Gaertneriomyces semiglobifer]|nr:hypothetical protein BC832DRAFT_548141 [Gaertneriomyces semiglobifer]
MSSTASTRGGVGPAKAAIAEQHPHGVTRHKIVISRPDASNKSYHIMRVMNSKFDLKSFIPPVRLTRELPKPREKFGRNNQEAATNGNGGGNGSGVAAGSSTGVTGPQTTATASTSNIPGKEKLDPTQIAPFGNAVRNRQNLFKKKTRTAIYGRLEDDDGQEPRRGRRDPDKFPWLLSDFDGSQQYVGNVEYMPNVRYMMMIRKGDEYKMMPVQKLYKFQPKPKYRTLTTEEADELLKQSARKRLDTWIMHQKREQEEVQSATDVDKKPTKAWAQKILEDGKANPARRSNQRANDGGEELDFEEEFADDEDVQFGIEDEEEQKEAVKRQYGSLAKRSGFLDDGDEDDELFDESARTAGRTIGKQLKKVLRKVNEDGNDVYHSDEDNPYASEESDEDDETENVKKEADTEEAVVAPAKRKGSDSARSSARGSPLISPEHMGAFGKRLKSSGSPAISPLHAAALGMPKKSARSPAHTSAGGSKATSPLSIGSPLGTPRDMKKRKATDEGTGGEKVSLSRPSLGHDLAGLIPFVEEQNRYWTNSVQIRVRNSQSLGRWLRSGKSHTRRLFRQIIFAAFPWRNWRKEKVVISKQSCGVHEPRQRRGCHQSNIARSTEYPARTREGKIEACCSIECQSFETRRTSCSVPQQKHRHSTTEGTCCHSQKRSRNQQPRRTNQEFVERHVHI